MALKRKGIEMAATVLSFEKLATDQAAAAGGKGRVLAQLYQQGYPVPDGFIIFPAAFDGERLTAQGWHSVQDHLNDLRHNGDGAQFAVRSSALSEDSAQASFAGEFESVLNVSSDDQVRDAIATVYYSRHAERVKVYSSVQGIEQAHEIAVVVQRMVASEISGVLFTADPVTGSYASMTGNYVYGLGEQLVSGEANAESFRLLRPGGDYEGPQALRQHAATLYKLATRLEKELGAPQDIEWAIAGGELYLLQARPVTTLSPGNLDTYEINDSLAEDALWINTNLAEAIPDVFTPLTWSVIRRVDVEQQMIPGYYLWSGNICGRVYSNISRRVSAATAMTGWEMDRVLDLLGDLFGQTPAEMNVPVYPYTRWSVIKQMAPRIWRMVANTVKAQLRLQRYLEETPQWTRQMRAHIAQTASKEELLSLWHDELWPYILKAWWSHTAGSTGIVNVMRLERNLTELVGHEDANTLLSNLRGESELASLGPLVGLSRVRQGQMTREQYLRQYGHRGPHELELSAPAPAEEPDWLEKQLAEFEKSDVDVQALLDRQRAQYEAARQRFVQRYPDKERWLSRQTEKAAKGARRREAARSEMTRVLRVVRAFMLKAAELTGVGEDIFFYYLDEVLEALGGKGERPQFIVERKENYERYKTLPPLPSFIRGRFKPFEWAKDPQRRVDYYDPALPLSAHDGDTLQGVPGAAGRVEGTVRLLAGPEEGDTLQPGEILVAATTNVGWTPLFPRAAAIITDIGAPLSHAAIVARELGIPAVVGSGNATTRLKSGDRVIVDGGQGVVHILDQNQETD
jgi:pyruvate,water dikinase